MMFDLRTNDLINKAIRAKKLESDKTVRAKFSDYKSRAKRDGLEFSIDIESFAIIVSNSCYVCGEDYNGKELLGVDRLDNDAGYTFANSRTCCWDCNRSKSDKTLNEYVNYLAKFGDKAGIRTLELKEKSERSKRLGIDNFAQAENDESNLELFNKDANKFVPNVYLTVCKSSDYYKKTFSMFGVLYSFIDSKEDTTFLPKDLISRLKQDSILYEFKQIPKNSMCDEMFFI